MDDVVWRSAGIRARHPAATLEALGDVAASLGVSRITDITRLDRLGIPVAVSVRPRAMVLRVHAGKSLQAIDARAGAAMEALEYAMAEPGRTSWRGRTLQVRQIVAGFQGAFRFVDLVPRFETPIALTDRAVCVECELLGTGGTLWIPAELVFVPYVPERHPQLFGWGSNGLASGNTLAEATLHGLLEVLERDVVAMHAARDETIRITGYLPAPFRELERAWRKTGVELAVRYLPNAFGLPCFHATLHERDSDTINLAKGHGLHFDRSIALTRAITEAAQSRLAHIHGGREDVVEFYDKFAALSAETRRADDASHVERQFRRDRRMDFADAPDLPMRGRAIVAMLTSLRKRVRRAGFPHVLRYRFAVERAGLAVVRVIVPGCEYFERHALRIGPRFLKRSISGG